MQQSLDFTPICLPIAKMLIKNEPGNLHTKAAFILDVLEKRRYILGNHNVAILEEAKQFKEVPEEKKYHKNRKINWDSNNSCMC